MQYDTLAISTERFLTSPRKRPPCYFCIKSPTNAKHYQLLICSSVSPACTLWYYRFLKFHLITFPHGICYVSWNSCWEYEGVFGARSLKPPCPANSQSNVVICTIGLMMDFLIHLFSSRNKPIIGQTNPGIPIASEKKRIVQRDEQGDQTDSERALNHNCLFSHEDHHHHLPNQYSKNIVWTLSCLSKQYITELVTETILSFHC